MDFETINMNLASENARLRDTLESVTKVCRAIINEIIEGHEGESGSILECSTPLCKLACNLAQKLAESRSEAIEPRRAIRCD